MRRGDGVLLGADPAIGQAILKVMVTSQKTKAALRQAEMVEFLDEAGAIRQSDSRDRELVEATRLGLEHVRLVRSFERGGQAFYELAHDTMAAEIATWISQEELAGKMAREFLRRGLDDWRSPERLLLRLETLALIHERREDLKRPGQEEVELLFRSALAHGYEVVTWFDRAQAAGVPADAIALEGLRSDSFRTRAAAVLALGQLDKRFADAVIPMLADLYPQVRAAAIASLERLQPDGAWRSHLKAECYVPAGEFIMGDDKGPNDDEKPAHRVTLNAFYIGNYPVTNAEYAHYREDIRQPFEMPAGKEDHPVAEVSWYDARDYAAWAGMRLLTEAEWERAASWELVDWETGRLVGKGRKRKYPWGDTFDKSKCNSSEAGIGKTTPVGMYSPGGDSPCGAADMAGNVREWVADWYDSGYYAGSSTDNPQGPESGSWRVVRGGSYLRNDRRVRCACRDWYGPDDRNHDIGFRVVCVSCLLYTSRCV